MAIAVHVCRDHTEAIGACRIAKAPLLRHFLEAAASEVLEEEIGLSRQSRWTDHDLRPVAPRQRAFRLEQVVPCRLHVARDVEVEIAVAVRVQEGAAGAPPTRGHAGLGGDVLERAVAAIAKEKVRTPVGDVQVEASIPIGVPRADAAAPRRCIDAGLRRHVFELPAAEVAVERVAVGDALAGRRQLRGGHHVDVEPAVGVVVDERDAVAGRFEDVILGGATRPGARGQRYALFECHG